ncbi:ABC transporter ATP-binding protein [Jiangella mangrovi]|uniref:ABC-2 type transport system ATP-binding protein n=1 Tax=Jiangella mangrovi TaxID=1524084 RepID=A0A7W9GUL5_9ACTN|nr:ABC transporter ATP-binding protein [Jiangella mangrovi]MBB5790367.1 ABC-2 type transport system ATP-binding protein [Jiangella mangrovi]
MTARGLVREFAPGTGVSGVDLDVGTGEIHAIVGLNGAGKTTLMRLLLGMLRPSAGIALIDGHDVASAPATVWARVGHLVDHPLAYAELTTRENVAVAARLHGVPRRRIDDAVTGVIVELGLDRYSDGRARTLSQGNRQRLGLAAALVHDPGVLVLDEPTNGLDPAGVVLLRESLLRRCADGAGVLVSSHHLDEVARVASRITVVNRGRIVGALDPHGVDIEREFFALIHADDEQYAS